jgi:hypothetical protein
MHVKSKLFVNMECTFAYIIFGLYAEMYICLQVWVSPMGRSDLHLCQHFPCGEMHVDM